MSKTEDSASIATVLETQASNPKASPESSSAVNDELAKKFGITSNTPHCLGLLHKIRELLAGSNILITDINHNQYQEAYFFSCNEETARIDIWYKDDGTVSCVRAQSVSDLANRLKSLLDVLKGRSFLEPKTNNVFNFSDPFFRELYETIVSAISENGISIQNIESFQYCQKYTFVRDDSVAKFDIWYNEKKQITKIAQTMNFLSNPGLVHDITLLLKNAG